MKVFSYDFNVADIVQIFCYLKYPRNRTVMKEGAAISEPPSTYAF